MNKLKRFLRLQKLKWLKKKCAHFCILCPFYKKGVNGIECNPYEILDE